MTSASYQTETGKKISRIPSVSTISFLFICYRNTLFVAFLNFFFAFFSPTVWSVLKLCFMYEGKRLPLREGKRKLAAAGPMRTGKRVFLKNDIAADLKKSCAEFMLFFFPFLSGLLFIQSHCVYPSVIRSTAHLPVLFKTLFIVT